MSPVSSHGFFKALLALNFDFLFASSNEKMKHRQERLIRGHREQSVLLTQSELQDLRGN